MKIFFAFIILVSLSVTGFDAQAQNQENASVTTGLRIAILDLGAIRTQSLVVKDIQTQIVGYRDGFRKNIAKEEAALKVANQELKKKRNVVTPEAFAQERRKFEQKVLAVQRLVQASKKALEQAQAKAMIEVEKNLNNIITKLAEKHNLSLILRREVTILASRSLEITGDVVRELNAQLPKVKVEKPVIK